MNRQPVCIDFETEAIQARPLYPPKPVGLAVKWPGQQSRYYAFGHPTGNNATRVEVAEELARIWTRAESVLCHNLKFDLDVAETHFYMPRKDWRFYHDTLFLLYLDNPHSSSLSLKPAAEKYLGVAPTERDAVKDWLIAAGVIPRNANPGPHIGKASGEVVGPYACGDVDRTAALFDLLHPRVLAAGMGPAYDRERRLLPILLDNERAGIRVDVERLEEDLFLYEQALVLSEDWLRRKLKAPSLNLDADGEVAAALDAAGLVTEWTLTPTGRRSTSKKNVKINEPSVAAELGYRNRLMNVLSQSMRPWLAQAKAGKGCISTDWNQVRGDNGGTRTGRLSCARFQNITKTFQGFDAPKKRPPLPLVRKYLIPDEGHVWLHRDYSQQEMRILAHYEEDVLAAAYRRDPRMDIYLYTAEAIKATSGLELTRAQSKVLTLALPYGMGIMKMAAALGVEKERAQTARQAQLAALPGLRNLDRELKNRGRRGEPLRTWGGRVYFCEPPVTDENGVTRSFEYKMLNTLIQGSAADQTKEALIRYCDLGRPTRLLVTVHDEINVSGPLEEMAPLKSAMESIEMDVPMLSDGKTGPSWGDLKKEE